MGDQLMPDQLSPQFDAAISLPGSLFELIDNHANTGIFFIKYDLPILFPVEGGGNNINRTTTTQTEVGSRILAATVGAGLNFQNLEKHRNVTVIFRLQLAEGKVNRNLFVAHNFDYMSTLL